MVLHCCFLAWDPIAMAALCSNIFPNRALPSAPENFPKLLKIFFRNIFRTYGKVDDIPLGQKNKDVEARAA